MEDEVKIKQTMPVMASGRKRWHGKGASGILEQRAHATILGSS